MEYSEVALYPVAPSIPKAHERSKRVVSYSHPIDIHQKRNPNTDNASKMQNAGKKQDALESEEEMEIVGVEVRSRPGALSVEAGKPPIVQCSSEEIVIATIMVEITLVCQIKSMMGSDDQHTGWQAS